MNQSSQANELPLIGAQIGDYMVLRRLGRGGMAHVFLAEQVSLSRLVALKVLKPDLASDPSYIQRFKNEARAAAALVHSNIVQIFEVGEFEGIHYIAQEYVAGMNLSQYLRDRGPVSPLMAVNVMTQVAAALRKARSLGVVHRDIKPENIMLSTDGEAKVADFGLARLDDQMQKSDLTQVGITMGTPLYMSPEQIEGRSVDHRADLYSFGVTAYHMLIGQPPFQGDNPISVAIQHAKDTAKPIHDLRPDLPEGLCAIVEKLMEKSADDRYQTASEVLDALRGIHIESTASDWQDLLRNLQLGSAGVDLGTSQLAATRRLETLMGKRSSLRWTSALIWISLLVLLPSLTGVVLASLQNRQSLEEIAASEPIENRKATIFDQYVYAVFDQSEDSWNAVINYTKGQPVQSMDQVWITFAKERLAEFYLNRERWSDASQIYQEFAKYRMGERWRTIGDYGLAIAQYHLDNEQPARKLIGDERVDRLPGSLRQHWDRIKDLMLEVGARPAAPPSSQFS